jgi:hypothetical protein
MTDTTAPMPIEATAAPLPADELDRVIDAVIETATTAACDWDVAADAVLEENARGYRYQAGSEWRPTTDGAAEWCARHWRTAMQEIADAKAQRDEWVAELDAWLDSRTRRPAATAAYRQSQLERYALARREADPKNAKTTALPSAVVKTIGHSERIDVQDGDEVLDWCLRNAPSHVTTVMKVNVTDVRDLARIEQQPTGRHQVGFACGTVVYMTLPDDLPTDADGNVWTDDLLLLCPEHHHGEKVITLQAELAPQVVADVLGRTSVPVPGVVVTPSYVTADVKPG